MIRRAVTASSAAGQQDEPSAAAGHIEEAWTAHELLDRRHRSLVRRRGWLFARTLMLADLAGLTASFFLTEWLVGVFRAEPDLSRSAELIAFAVSLPMWIVIANAYGLYGRDDPRTDHSTADDVIPVFHMLTVGVWVWLAIAKASGLADPRYAKLVVFWATALVFVTLARTVARRLSSRHPAFIQNTIIVGGGAVAQVIARKLRLHPEYGLNLVGFVGRDEAGAALEGGETPVIATTDDIPSIVRAFDVERVILIPDTADDTDVTLVHELMRLDVHIDVVPSLYQVLGPGIDVHSVEGLPLIGLARSRLRRRDLFLKRVIDLVMASVMLVLSTPFFAYAAYRIKRESPGPVFFRQTRLGMNMREITMLKFRTMFVDVDHDIHRRYIQEIMRSDAQPTSNGLYKLERAEAVTRFGGWLRRTSLDELPQLVNVLRGDMSLVGPRPCLPYELEHFQPHHYERFLVPAGLTGLWQVAARARSTFLEALELDVAYVRGWSLGLDFWLILRTPLQLVGRRRTA